MYQGAPIAVMVTKVWVCGFRMAPWAVTVPPWPTGVSGTTRFARGKALKLLHGPNRHTMATPWSGITPAKFSAEFDRLPKKPEPLTSAVDVPLNVTDGRLPTLNWRVPLSSRGRDPQP